MSHQEQPSMCDYSLQNVSSRPARVGDKLTVRDFGTRTRGFCAAEATSLAVCILPGPELAFAADATRIPMGLLPWRGRKIGHKTAIFRQINLDRLAPPSYPLEFSRGP